MAEPSRPPNTEMVMKSSREMECRPNAAADALARTARYSADEKEVMIPA